MMHSLIEKWGRFEISLEGPSSGNPFTEQDLYAKFHRSGSSVIIKGFYDGDGVYRIRFMPDQAGEWTYETVSSTPELHGHKGTFCCTEPSAGNHGPVRVKNEGRFAYADGTPYYPFGTTAYAWIHQDTRLCQLTVETLAASPFNKVRMCIFPKYYPFNAAEPELFPYQGSREQGFDTTCFHPAFFRRLETYIDSLQQLGIEADVILFHPYDGGHWGFDRMDAASDERYLHYVLARLASFRNVWWSLANEYDFMKEKKESDWDRLFTIVAQEDPYGHLRSIHNGTRMYDPDSIHFYDHAKPWVTHCSIQHWDVTLTPVWLKAYNKPVIVDECCYEGNLPQRWGNITAEEMTHRFWDGMIRGGYVSHGETYTHPDHEIWWAKGGRLYGDSPQMIGFLRQILESAPAEARPLPVRDVPVIGVENEYYLHYYGLHRPAYRTVELPQDVDYAVDIIETQRMTITSLEGTFSGTCRIDLPGKPFIAVRIYRVK